jgi:outer membrane protein OmpA-like peptidoglycan-associated protein
MRDFGYWARRIGAAGAVAVLGAALGGCSGWPGTGHQGGASTGAPGSSVTQHVPASALLVVTNGPGSATAASGLVAATARPNEQLRIVASGTPPQPVVAADAPPPVTIALAAPPAAPGKGATTYQTAGFTRKMKAWQATRAADVSAEAAQTRAADVAWAAKLAIAAKIRQLGDPLADEGSPAVESAVAASAQPGLAAGAGDPFGSRRVVVLFCDSLAGPLPAGELTGDDVIVVTSYLASAAGVSAAQAAVLQAGAAQVAVLGPLATPGQLSALVSAGLSGVAGTGAVSGTVLFGNGSYALSTAAAAILGPLVPRLKEPGATAVINGFASTPGTAEGNYLLSYQRATAAARYLEAHGVAATALIIVGHGASDTVGAGDSAANRRVLVVVEESAA